MSYYVDNETVLSGINQSDQVALFERIRMKVGAPVMGVELTDDQIKWCLVEAIEEYSTMINNWALENRMAEMLGLPSSVDFTMKYVTNSLTFEKSLTTPFAESQGYATPGGRELKKDAIFLTAGTQDYTIPPNRDINEVMWYTPSFVNFYGLDPSVNIAVNEFGAAFQGYSLYTVMPVFDTILSSQAAELRNKVRGAEYAYRIKNGPNGTYVISFYPVPVNSSGGTQGIGIRGGTPGTVFYEYYDRIGVAGNSQFSGTNANPSTPSSAITSGNGLISSPADAQLNYLSYNLLNSPSKSWVKKYTQALAKELLGYLRGKFNGQLPIPDAEVTLNSADLLSNGKSDQEKLKEDLKELLSKLNYKNILEERAATQEAINKSLGFGSLGIWLG